jgi:hypothetical protein
MTYEKETITRNSKKYKLRKRGLSRTTAQADQPETRNLGVNTWLIGPVFVEAEASGSSAMEGLSVALSKQTGQIEDTARLTLALVDCR